MHIDLGIYVINQADFPRKNPALRSVHFSGKVIFRYRGYKPFQKNNQCIYILQTLQFIA